MVPTSVLALGACVFVSAADGFAFLKKQTYTANFTTGAVCDAGPGICEPVNIPGLYDDLYYSTLRPFLTPLSSYYEGGVLPHSGDWGACFGPKCAVGNDQNVDVVDRASISANYNRSRVLFFDVTSFYFGCTAVHTLRNVYSGPPPDSYSFYDPSPCNLTVKGYRNTLQQLPAASVRPFANVTFTYKPDPHPRQPNLMVPRDAAMQKFTLPQAFAGLRTLTFELNKTPVEPDTAESSWQAPAGYLDDISYKVTKLRC